MRFEKINNNKIRITLTNEDLAKKDVDFHSFMANSIESQDLFLDCLKEAEKEIGFVTKNYSLRIEALAMPSSGDFILTITRTLPEKHKKYSKKNVHTNINKNTINYTQVVYSFLSFDDYCNFISFLKNNNLKLNTIADSIMLYEYNNLYYLIFYNINFSYSNLKTLLCSITEFGELVNEPSLFIRKLFEKGNIIMKNNALKLSFKYL